MAMGEVANTEGSVAPCLTAGKQIATGPNGRSAASCGVGVATVR